MQFFVTGGSGSLGVNVLQYVLEQYPEAEVRALSRSERADQAILAAVGKNSKRVRIIRGDLHNEEALREGMEGCEVVVHMAAKVGDIGTYPDFIHDNVTGTRNVLAVAVTAGVRKFIYVSSFVILAKHHDLAAGPQPFAYSDDNPPPPPTPRSPENVELIPDWASYSKSKALAENLVLAANPEAKPVVCSVRLGWLWAATEKVLLPMLIDVLNNPGWPLMPRTWPNSTCHMRNACEGIGCAIERGQHGAVYEIADPQGPMAMEDWAPRYVAVATGKPEIAPPVDAWRLNVKLLWRIIVLLDHLPRSMRWPASWFTAMSRQALTLLFWDFRLDTTRSREEIGYIGKVEWEEGCEEIKSLKESRE
ncbi:hypothetical protein BC937DRAFT_89511 [Endogone sp. FLAS-F59071]|nr:hypothetical protein BC937DRAFT_89511 [Endogone sp. FLAS-F59071]|eukprot:RUS17768.1 hypothetical protein BC937DRAFT_89511 [Endogone sp. FLAS-F59071]